VPVTDKKSSGAALKEFKKQTGYEFKGIDVLNVSVGTAKYIDLKNPQNNRTQKIDIENCVMKNVKSTDDLVGLMAFVALRGSDVFSVLVDKKASSNKPNLLDLLF
jgi:hypothetical protein